MVINSWGKTYNLRFVTTTYADNKSLAVQALCEDGEPYGIITINLPETDLIAPYERKNCAYLDTNNCGNVIDKMVACGYIDILDDIAYSGFCTYPLGRFTEKFFAEEGFKS